MSKDRDVFICHAGEDKESVVRPLARAIEEHGMTYWLDEKEIGWGESITERVNWGLSNSRCVIVVISAHSIEKPWPTRELNAVLGLEAGTGKVILLPLLVGASSIRETFLERLPLLRDKRYLIWSNDPTSVARALQKQLGRVASPELFGKLEARPEADPLVEASREHRKSRSAANQFFQRAFERSFPGVRGLREFRDPQEISMRLQRLLEETEMSLASGSRLAPIWYWRGGNGAISHFRDLGNGTFLLNYYELPVTRIVASNSGAYYNYFVYVEVGSMPPTGLYPHADSNIEWHRSQGERIFEEYAVYSSGLSTREEYDDGAAFVAGALVDLGGEAELRRRCLDPYNLVIASVGSPINNTGFDYELVERLDAILAGTETVEQLADRIGKLRRIDL